MRLSSSLAFLLVCACVAPGSAAPEPAEPESAAPAPEARTESYAWAFLRTGSETLEGEALAEVMEGHFANMGRLADAGALIVAGPLGAPRIDPDDRGIFLFDVPDVQRARELCATDPALAAGVLRAEVFELRSASPLRDFIELYREDVARREAAGMETFSGRGYVLVTAPDPAASLWAIAALVEGGQVIFHGRLDPDGQDLLLFALDVRTPEQASELLRFAAPDASAGWNLHPWYASDVFAELARR